MEEIEAKNGYIFELPIRVPSRLEKGWDAVFMYQTLELLLSFIGVALLYICNYIELLSKQKNKT